jgi:glutamate dehydrogenase (NAD(P)+)
MTLSASTFMKLKIQSPTVLEVSDAKAGLTGWLAVDSVVASHFCGGLRMLPDVSTPELIELARAMTLKHAFLGLPHGGAKAGIVYDQDRQKAEKAKLLTAFARNIEDLLRRRAYLPGADMGTTGQDIREMMQSIGICVPSRALRGGLSGWYTSLTVVASSKAAARHQGLDLAKADVAIEGFGSVGSAVAEGFNRLGSRVVAISTFDGALHAPEGLDVGKLIQCYRQHGSKLVDFFDGRKIQREALLELDVDILVPCARHHSIQTGNAPQIKARLISCGANAPITKEAEKLLWQRGILCIPDFVANSGGVLGGTMEFAGISPDAIAGFMDQRFARQVSALIGEAHKEDVYIRDKAERVAADRWKRVKSASEQRSLRNRVFSLGLDLYRNGMIPAALVGKLALKYFQKRVEGEI